MHTHACMLAHTHGLMLPQTIHYCEEKAVIRFSLIFATVQLHHLTMLHKFFGTQCV